MSFYGSTDFLIEVQKGNVPKHSIVHKFGRNDAVPNNTWQHVNLLQTATWQLQAATLVRVKAGNVNDATGGSGAREITIVGLDNAFAPATEAVATAGTSASSNTSTSFCRINRAYVSASGTYATANTADVIIENSAGSLDLIQIEATEGQSQFGAYTIPLGKTGYLLSAILNADGGKAADFRMFTMNDIDDISAPMSSPRIKLNFDGILGHQAFMPRSPHPGHPAKSDIWWEARGGGAQTEVSVDFEILLIDD